MALSFFCTKVTSIGLVRLCDRSFLLDSNSPYVFWNWKWWNDKLKAIRSKFGWTKDKESFEGKLTQKDFFSLSVLMLKMMVMSVWRLQISISYLCYNIFRTQNMLGELWILWDGQIYLLCYCRSWTPCFLYYVSLYRCEHGSLPEVHYIAPTGRLHNISEPQLFLYANTP